VEGIGRGLKGEPKEKPVKILLCNYYAARPWVKYLIITVKYPFVTAFSFTSLCDFSVLFPLFPYSLALTWGTENEMK